MEILDQFLLWFLEAIFDPLEDRFGRAVAWTVVLSLTALIIAVAAWIIVTTTR